MSDTDAEESIVDVSEEGVITISHERMIIGKMYPFTYKRKEMYARKLSDAIEIYETSDLIH